MGAGGLGLMCLELLKAMGGKGTIVVDIDPAKRQAALDAGAVAAIDGNAPDAVQQIIAANGGVPVQAVVDLVGAPSTTSIAFDSLIKGGKLVFVGVFGGAAPWPIAFIPMKAISILGSYTGSLEEMRQLMQLVKDGKIDQFIDKRGMKRYLPLHELKPYEEYILGVFLVPLEPSFLPLAITCLLGILGASILGSLVGLVVRRPLLVLQLVAFTSYPFFFGSGASWPGCSGCPSRPTAGSPWGRAESAATSSGPWSRTWRKRCAPTGKS